MPQHMGRAFFVLMSVALTGCVVSFDGYELGDADASAGTGGTGAGATGGVGSGGGTGGATGGNAGTSGTGATGGVSDGGTGATGGSAGSAGVAGAAGGGGTGGTPLSCPNKQGGDMVLIPLKTGGSTCIDANEVVQQDYYAFLGTSPDPQQQITQCKGQSFDPGVCQGWDPTNFKTRPAVCVDWCDAVGFCKFVGKRLCGATNGGPLAPSSANDAAQDEWYNACSAGGTKLFPYGDLYEGQTCNGLQAPTAGPTTVSFYAACIGGYPGIFGMSGNVREWVDSCTGSNCMQRGGSWIDGSSGSFNLTCLADATSKSMGAATTKNEKVGFRCCADPG